MRLLAINKNRESGIELLKVFALFGIVWVHTYTNFTLAVDYSDGLLFFDKTYFSTISYYLFQLILPFGYLGNMIFYVSTSWFLVDAKKIKIEKIISMSINAIIMTALCYLINVACGHQVSLAEIIRLFFPITGMKYWFISCYVLLYAISPLLNVLINSIDKRMHFNFCLISFLLYFVFIYFSAISELYINKLYVFILVYFIVAYFKKYKSEFCNNTKKQLVLLIISTGIFYFMITYNFAIAPINIKWHEMYNPFLLCMAFSLLNIFRKISFQNTIINTFSGLSMYVYMFHSNMLNLDVELTHFCSLILKSGTNAIFIRVLLSSLLLFFVSLMICSFYYAVFNKCVNKISAFFTIKIEKASNLLFNNLG